MSDLLTRLCNDYANLKRELQGGPPVNLSPPRKRPKEYNPYVCIRDGCNSRDFEIDQRGGNRVCVGCGAVQNTFSLTVAEPERRNFDDGPDHRHTERLEIGESGTSAPAAHKYASRLAEASATDKTAPDIAKERKIKAREQRYKTCIRDLAAGIVNFRPPMLNLAMMYAHNLASAVSDHLECCTVAGCRLNRQPDKFLVAAALVRKAAKFYGLNMSPGDLSGTYLKTVGYEYDMKRVSNACTVVDSLINGYEGNGQYSCMVANVQAPTGEPTNGLLRYTERVQRFCETLELPYPTQCRATENVTDWFNKGLPGNKPNTIAGAAVWSVVKNDGTQIEIEAVAEAAGCAADTIKNVLDKICKI